MLCVVLCSIALFGFIFLIVLNNKIYHSERYKNRFAYAFYYLDNKHENNEIIFLGSTYAQFACQSIDAFNVSASNLGCYARPLEYDLSIVKKECENVVENGKVVLILSPCILLVDDGFEDLSGNHCLIFKKSELRKISLRQYIKIKYPIFNLKVWKDVLYDEGYIGIEEKYLKETHLKDAESNMIDRINIWKKQMKVSDFKNVIIDKEKEQVIQRNISYLKKIEEECKKRKLEVYFVTMPISSYLYDQYSEAALDEILYKPLKGAFTEDQIIDFIHDDDFKGADLYVDGGFLLNSLGSRKFLRKIYGKIIDEC